MTLRSVVLVAMMSGLSFFHMREASAITSCSVCADQTHLCSFPCYVGTPGLPGLVVTTCKGAGYKCLKGLPVATLDTELCQTEPAPSAVSALASLVTTWWTDSLRLAIALHDQVARLDRAGDTLALAAPPAG